MKINKERVYNGFNDKSLSCHCVLEWDLIFLVKGYGQALEQRPSLLLRYYDLRKPWRRKFVFAYPVPSASVSTDFMVLYKCCYLVSIENTGQVRIWRSSGQCQGHTKIVSDKRELAYRQIKAGTFFWPTVCMLWSCAAISVPLSHQLPSRTTPGITARYQCFPTPLHTTDCMDGMEWIQFQLVTFTVIQCSANKQLMS